MEPVDWHRVQCGGMPELLKVLQEMESELLPQARMGAWWFRRYAELYLHLVGAGMPAELEGAAVGEWLARRIGGGEMGANGHGERTGSGTG